MQVASNDYTCQLQLTQQSLDNNVPFLEADTFGENKGCKLFTKENNQTLAKRTIVVNYCGQLGTYYSASYLIYPVLE